MGISGTQTGDKWCVCVTRWKSRLERNRAAPVDLEATHASALEFVTLEDLKAHVLKLIRVDFWPENSFSAQACHSPAG